MKQLAAWMLTLGAMLVGCAASLPAIQEDSGEAEETASAKDLCRDRDVLVFLCQQDACAFYRCRDVAFQELVLTRGVGGVAQPATGSAVRWWGSGREGLTKAEPVFEIPWKQTPLPLLPSEQAAAEESAKHPKVKHHIFSVEFKKWFERQGITSIHEQTLLMEVDDHKRIHQGERGGPWNQAWRDFISSHPAATRKEIWSHAAELCARFQLFGKLVPYYR